MGIGRFIKGFAGFAKNMLTKEESFLDTGDQSFIDAGLMPSRGESEKIQRENYRFLVDNEFTDNGDMGTNEIWLRDEVTQEFCFLIDICLDYIIDSNWQFSKHATIKDFFRDIITEHVYDEQDIDNIPSLAEMYISDWIITGKTLDKIPFLSHLWMRDRKGGRERWLYERCKIADLTLDSGKFYNGFPEPQFNYKYNLIETNNKYKYD